MDAELIGLVVAAVLAGALAVERTRVALQKRNSNPNNHWPDIAKSLAKIEQRLEDIWDKIKDLHG